MNVQPRDNSVQETFSLGLIGYPLGHSLSPQIHKAALHASGLSGTYKLYPVFPGSQHDPQKVKVNTLEGLLAQVRDGKIHGLNVTIPHKQNVIPLLDQLTPAAKAIGAVNTIFLKGSSLIGDNTDAPGFLGDLLRLLSGSDSFHSPEGRPGETIFPSPYSALVLGAGGSARAVVYALLSNGCRVTITSRRVEQAQALRDQLSTPSFPISVAKTIQESIKTRPFSLVVNTTPVGMHPHEEASPWPDQLPLPQDAAVYDLVYNPRKTVLIRHAHETGVPAASGVGMLIEQAALAFERWTGIAAPRQAMMAAINDE